jgi:hypothetical protein
VTTVVEPGRRCLGDRYELHQLIAAGGMGQVWRGLDIALHRPVAVKVLRSEYTGDPTFVARFRAEAQHAASLSHPNIAAVFDYGEEIAQDGTGETLAYLVMELVEGEPLSALLARVHSLDTATTLSLLRQTSSALAEAHRAGMVHRDVKPGNLLVLPDGRVKITDFGIAWSARSVALTRTGQVIGTPQYLSPEQAEGRLATPASDVYALGLIGYECLAGHPAFDGDNAVSIALKQVQQEPEPLPGELPPGVRTLITRSLAKDPAVRLPDGAAFAAAIEDVLAGRPVDSGPATVAVGHPAADDVPVPGATAGGERHVIRPPARRRRERTAIVLLPLLGLLAGAGIAAALLQLIAGDGPRSTAAAAAAEQGGQQGVVLDADDYIGRPVDDVAAQLAAFGLSVKRQAVPDADAVPGIVTDVDPSGEELLPGDTVVVHFAAEGAERGERRTGGPSVTGASVGDGAAAGEDGGTPTQDGEPSVAPADGATPTDLPAEPTPSGAPEPSAPTSTATGTGTETATETTESTAPTEESDDETIAD